MSGIDFGDRFSDDEMQTAHMRLVFDTIVRQHPSFTEFRDQDGSSGSGTQGPRRAAPLLARNIAVRLGNHH